jgi:hypothetical protein
MIRYTEPRSARYCLSRKHTRVPTIGPTIVPIPPITTAKIMNAVQFTLNVASGWSRRRLR